MSRRREGGIGAGRKSEVKADPGEARRVFGSVRVPCIVAASVACAASPSYSQIDLAAVGQAVRECVAQVRQDAIRRENYDLLGQPPMWRNFDAYVSPDGRVHKLDFHPGDCWIKLSGWEKQLAFSGFISGGVYNYDFAERQEYNRMGSSAIRFIGHFDASKAIPYFYQLYSVQENRTIWWSDAFDLLYHIQANPQTKDIPGLTALYQKHDKPLFSGYLRKFVPPNKVVISELNDTYQPPEARNRTVTITLLSVSTESNSKAVSKFMAALLNVKQCNTLIPKTEGYKYYPDLKTDQQRQQTKEFEQLAFYPQLNVVVEYPSALNDKDEFFNGRNELSGIILLEKGQSVCLQKQEGDLIVPVNLGQLMLDGLENKNEYSTNYLLRNRNDFVNLNQYLIANGLRTDYHDEDDPRPALHYSGLFYAQPAPDGVKKILTVGAAQ
jgi:hypothetical protein